VWKPAPAGQFVPPKLHVTVVVNKNATVPASCGAWLSMSAAWTPPPPQWFAFKLAAQLPYATTAKGATYVPWQPAFGGEPYLGEAMSLPIPKKFLGVYLPATRDYYLYKDAAPATITAWLYGDKLAIGPNGKLTTPITQVDLARKWVLLQPGSKLHAEVFSLCSGVAKTDKVMGAPPAPGESVPLGEPQKKGV
jgi:hypothetical protein